MGRKQAFTKSELLDHTKKVLLEHGYDGVKVEVLLTQNLTEYDELNVNMYWRSMDSFAAWRNSDAFKSAHKRPEPGSEKETKDSPILNSEIITYEVASAQRRKCPIRPSRLTIN